jgi:subtilisin
MVSGILTAKNELGVTGIVPDAELSHAKVIGTDGECQYNSLVAAFLWSVVKEVDVILVSLGTDIDYSILHDAVKKAYNAGICIIAAAGNAEGIKNYPASYEEVLAVERLNYTRTGKFEASPGCVKMVLPDREFYTTHLHGRFTKASGTSLCAALGAGLAALLIEKNRGKTRPTPNSIYSELASLSYRNLGKEYPRFGA